MIFLGIRIRDFQWTKYAIVYLALIAPTLTGCNEGNEYFPTKEAVTPIVSTEVVPNASVPLQSDFSPKVPGRYVLFLTMKPNASFDAERWVFTLRGSIEIVVKSGHSNYVAEYGKEISNKTGSTTLHKMEIAKEDIDDIVGISFQIDSGDEILASNFSDIRIHVKRELKNSLFD